LRVEYRDYSDRTIASDYILLLNPRGRAMASQKWAELTAAPMPWDIGQAIKTLQEAGHPDFIETAKNKGGFTEVVRRIRSEQST
jgi:hypothetical protein